MISLVLVTFRESLLSWHHMVGSSTLLSLISPITEMSANFMILLSYLAPQSCLNSLYNKERRQQALRHAGPESYSNVDE